MYHIFVLDYTRTNFELVSYLVFLHKDIVVKVKIMPESFTVLLLLHLSFKLVLKYAIE